MTLAEQWDERHRRPADCARTEPAGFLRDVLPMLPAGWALDLAVGNGCNAVFLVQKGWHVTGVDFSRVALEKAATLAREKHVPLTQPDPSGRAASPGLFLFEADLESYSLPVDRFNVVLGFNYLQRSLFPAIELALRKGGRLVYETYTLEQLKFFDGPRSPEHLLRRSELREAFPQLKILFYRELNAGKGIASLLAEKL